MFLSSNNYLKRVEVEFTSVGCVSVLNILSNILCAYFVEVLFNDFEPFPDLILFLFLNECFRTCFQLSKTLLITPIWVHMREIWFLEVGYQTSHFCKNSSSSDFDLYFFNHDPLFILKLCNTKVLTCNVSFLSVYYSLWLVKYSSSYLSSKLVTWNCQNHIFSTSVLQRNNSRLRFSRL